MAAPAPASAAAAAAATASEASDQVQVPPHPDLAKAHSLATLIASEPERFTNGDPSIAQLSVLALKQLFDLSVKSEALAVPLIGKFLHSITPEDDSAARSTRSSSKRKRGQNAGKKAKEPESEHPLFQPTPLDELVVDGMDARQLWEQIDLKGFKLQTLLETVLVNENGQAGLDDDDEADAADGNESDDEDPGEQKVKLSDLTDADLRALGLDPAKRDQIIFDDDDDNSDEESDPEPYAGASDISDGDPNEVFYEPLRTEAEQRRRKEEQEMSILPRLRSQAKRDDDDDEEEWNEDEDGDEQGGEDEDSVDEEDEEDGRTAAMAKKQRSILDSLDEPGTNGAGPSGKGKRHPTLDDDFFSINEFNRLTEAQEMAEATRDPLNDDEDEDLANEVDFFRDVDGLGGELDDEVDDDLVGRSRASGMKDPSELQFADFFLPPAKAQRFRAQAEKKAGNKGKGKGKGKGKAKEASEVEVDADAADEEEDKDEDGIEDDESQQEAEEPERPRSIRFNDTVAIRRIKPRKKKRNSELTPELLAALGFTEEDAERLADEPDALGEWDEEEEEEDNSEEGSEEDDGMDVDEDEDEDEDGFEHEQGDEDDEDEDEDEDGDEGGDGASLPDDEAQAETARRVAGDLFADSEDEDGTAAQSSSHEKRLAALQEEIARLESENVGQKDWTLRGEAGSKVRPQDSLLQEDLEFERTAKVTPQVTEETTETLEQMIKRRILDGQFDDVVRRREFEALPFLPSRLLELSDAKSAKSLAELYEEEYQAARGGANGEGARVAEVDAKLQKEHEAIAQIFEDVCGKLDALSNAHFTPKAPKATIQTLSNTPVVSIEEALPSTASSATMLAPEEVYERQRHAVALEGEKSEMTPEERQRLHHTLRREKRANNDRIEGTRRALELAGLRRRGSGKTSREEKDEAMRKLIGGRGVTVIGKDGSQKKGKDALGKKKGGASDAAAGGTGTSSGSRFKL